MCIVARAFKKRGAGPICINVMDVNMGDSVCDIQILLSI